MATTGHRDPLGALHPLPQAIARELASLPVVRVEELVARFPAESPAVVRLAVATLIDTDTAYAPTPGRICLRPWVRAAVRERQLDERIPFTVTDAGRAALGL